MRKPMISWLTRFGRSALNGSTRTLKRSRQMPFNVSKTSSPECTQFDSGRPRMERLMKNAADLLDFGETQNCRALLGQFADALSKDLASATEGGHRLRISRQLGLCLGDRIRIWHGQTILFRNNVRLSQQTQEITNHAKRTFLAFSRSTRRPQSLASRDYSVFKPGMGEDLENRRERVEDNSKSRDQVCGHCDGNRRSG